MDSAAIDRRGRPDSDAQPSRPARGGRAPGRSWVGAAGLVGLRAGGGQVIAIGFRLRQVGLGVHWLRLGSRRSRPGGADRGWGPGRRTSSVAKASAPRSSSSAATSACPKQVARIKAVHRACRLASQQSASGRPLSESRHEGDGIGRNSPGPAPSCKGHACTEQHSHVAGQASPQAVATRRRASTEPHRRRNRTTSRQGGPHGLRSDSGSGGARNAQTPPNAARLNAAAVPGQGREAAGR
jgi:hypothetical protein